MEITDTTEKSLTITVGQATSTGLKEQNEDCIGVYIPDASSLHTKGIAAVIADGVSAASGGKVAAEMCVQSFLSDYYSTPDSWSVKTSGHRVLTALNRWLYGQGHSEGLADEKGYLSTHSSIFFVSNTASIFHIGDTRIYRIRAGKIKQLTQDHSTQISKETTYLSRAMGLNMNPKVDFKETTIHAGDIFLLTSDGVHDWLRDKQLLDIVESADSLDSAAESHVGLALQSGSNDNLTSLIVRVDSVPESKQDELQRFLRERPFPPLLYPGMRMDGLEVVDSIFESPRSQLYRVRDLLTGEHFAMKTPSPNFSDDLGYIDSFITEEWIGKRVSHKNLIPLVDRARKPTFLYYLMREVTGLTLSQWMAENNGHTDTLRVVQIIEQIVSGVRALHRKETLHQDLKLDNIMLNEEGVPIIIDYGSCRVESLHSQKSDAAQQAVLGTLEFTAPEYRLEISSSIGPRSDQFSIAMIAYHLLSNGKCPYGDAWEKAKTFKDFEVLKYTPIYQHSPIVPVWIDGALKQALSIRAESRYSSMSEFVADLKHPNRRFTSSRQLSMIERDPLKFWRALSFVLFILLLVSLLR